MTRTKRTILALVLLELILAGLWWYLADMAATSPNASPESGRVIGQTLGAAMGIVLGLSPLLYLLARSNDRKAAAKRGE
ncbi:MAG TPA: hypothetical protein VFR28_07850 [Allosphingosinicella sp.]|jgi:hypothetical protein|nr:hypothetical protein [Allosphingosinicella sp.]